MERLRPIHVIEYELRRQGIFMLVDFDRRRLWFYGTKGYADINRMMESLKGRGQEMVKYLTARAVQRGETT
jgi:hypothetical protein